MSVFDGITFIIVLGFAFFSPGASFTCSATFLVGSVSGGNSPPWGPVSASLRFGRYTTGGSVIFATISGSVLLFM